MTVTIQQEHLQLARRLGACSVDRYKVGQPISEVASSDLAWMERRAPEIAKSLVAQLCETTGLVARAPLSLALFGDGSGSGSGSGYGYGSGYGDGSGSGSGYGYGFGYGSGDGSGSGSGYGYGYGDGDGASSITTS